MCDDQVLVKEYERINTTRSRRKWATLVEKCFPKKKTFNLCWTSFCETVQHCIFRELPSYLYTKRSKYRIVGSLEKWYKVCTTGTSWSNSKLVYEELVMSTKHVLLRSSLLNKNRNSYWTPSIVKNYKRTRTVHRMHRFSEMEFKSQWEWIPSMNDVRNIKVQHIKNLISGKDVFGLIPTFWTTSGIKISVSSNSEVSNVTKRVTNCAHTVNVN